MPPQDTELNPHFLVPSAAVRLRCPPTAQEGQRTPLSSERQGVERRCFTQL